MAAVVFEDCQEFAFGGRPLEQSLGRTGGLGKEVGEHSREISADGFVTLRQGDEVIWKRRCISKTKDSVVAEGNLGHKLEGDVLNIEGRYRAKREN